MFAAFAPLRPTAADPVRLREAARRLRAERLLAASRSLLRRFVAPHALGGGAPVLGRL